MENEDTFFPQDTYKEHLTILNEVNFTRREVDIMACLFNARGTSKIASFLSIAPKTVINHIRNIMLKVECNSREGIIDFIERSHKASLVRKHYSNLVIQAEFEKKLKEISKLIKGERPSLNIASLDNAQFSKQFIELFETALKLIGCTVLVKTRQKNIPLSRFLAQSQEVDTVYVLSSAEAKELSIDGSVAQDKNSSLPQGIHLENILFIFFEEMDIKALSGEDIRLKYADLSKEPSYYLSFFEILQKAFPYLELQRVRTEFQRQYEYLDISADEKSSQHEIEIRNIKEKSISFLEQNRTFLISWNIYFLIAGFIVIGLSILGMGYLSFSPYGPEGLKEPSSVINKEAIRSDFILPSDLILLQRPELIEQINDGLKNKKGIQSVALVGIGGTGKTTIARQYAHEQKANVIWEVNAETKCSLVESFGRLAQALSRTEEDKKILRGLQTEKDCSERKERIISFVKERLKLLQPWILIYDNVESFADIQPFFPQDRNIWGEGRVIVTTRNNNIQNNHFINQIIQLGELNKNQKCNLFTQIMHHGKKEKLTASQDKELRDFLGKIPPFPLDISVAAYYVKTMGLSYAKYLEQLDHQDKDFSTVQENLLKEAGDYTNTRYNIITLPLHGLITHHKDFAGLLLLISLVNSQNIPRELLNSYTGNGIVDDFIYNLNKYSLITVKKTSSPSEEYSLSIHRSTQQIILAYLTKALHLEGNKKLLIPVAYSLQYYIAGQVENEELSKINTILIHGQTFLSHRKIIKEPIRSYITNEIGIGYYYLGDYKKAQELLEKSLTQLYKTDSKNLHKIARSLLYLGSIHNHFGLYPQAREVLEKSASIYKESPSLSSVDFAKTLSHLGSSYRYLGNYEKAKESLEKSLFIYQQNPPKNQVRIAQTLLNLGNVYRNLGNYKKAKILLGKSLRIYQTTSKNPLEIAKISVYLGRLEDSIGNYESAKRLAEQGLLIYKQHLSPTHIDVAWASTVLGIIYRNLGALEKAKALFEEALMIYEKGHPNNHSDFAWVFTQLGNVYTSLGSYEKAKDFFEKSLRIHEDFFGKDHTETARVLRGLGYLYFARDNVKKAEVLFKRSLKLFEKSNSSDSYIILEDLAETYLRKSQGAEYEGKQEEKKVLKEQTLNKLSQALEILKTHFPENSPHKVRIEKKIKNLMLAD